MNTKPKWRKTRTPVWYAAVCLANSRRIGTTQSPESNLRRSISCKQSWERKSQEEKSRIIKNTTRGRRKYLSTITEERRKEIGSRISAGWSAEARAEASIRKKSEWQDPVRAKRWRDSLVRRSRRPSYRASLRESQTPERRAAQAVWAAKKRVQQSRPNQCEILLEKILEENFPGVFKFNDCPEGQIIANKVPDFICTSTPDVILELFGSYWHGPLITGRSRREEEKHRRDYFRQFGYRVVIIWEADLQDEPKIVKTVHKVLRVR